MAHRRNPDRCVEEERDGYEIAYRVERHDAPEVAEIPAKATRALSNDFHAAKLKIVVVHVKMAAVLRLDIVAVVASKVAGHVGESKRQHHQSCASQPRQNNGIKLRRAQQKQQGHEIQDPHQDQVNQRTRILAGDVNEQSLKTCNCLVRHFSRMYILPCPQLRETLG